MWLPDDPDFTNHEASIFLLSSWCELFFAFTPDSNQPRLHNVASLIEELLSISKRWETEPRFENHVNKIKDELKQTVADEDDFLCKIPEYRYRSQQLAKANSPVKVQNGCQILIDQRKQYEDTLVESISSAIDGLPQKKEMALKSIRRLATIAFQAGKEDDDVWNPLDKDPSLKPSELFHEIIKHSKSEKKKYLCTLAIIRQTDKTHSALRMAGFSPVSKSKLHQDYLTKFTELNEQLMFVEFDIESTSIRNAVSICRKQLDIVTGMVSLYENSQSSHIHPEAWVSSGDSTTSFSQSDQAFRRLHPRSRAKLDIQEGLVFLNEGESVDKRLLGAIELLSLASSSSDSRVRLTNLWSTVETLSGGHEGNTTLERVSSLLVPLIISRYVGRATRYLAIETHQLGSLLNNFDYGVGFSRSNKRFVSPEDMLKTLTSPKDSPPIKELLDFAQHPLLRNRIYCTWKIFHEPKKLRTMLIQSKKRLEWHIARIYRARNLLIHEGEESPFLVPLLDNLQSYLAMAVQRLIHELKKQPAWDVRQAIEFWDGKMEYLLSSLKGCPNMLTGSDFFDNESKVKIWDPSNTVD